MRFGSIEELRNHLEKSVGAAGVISKVLDARVIASRGRFHVPRIWGWLIASSCGEDRCKQSEQPGRSRAGSLTIFL